MIRLSRRPFLSFFYIRQRLFGRFCGFMANAVIHVKAKRYPANETELLGQHLLGFIDSLGYSPPWTQQDFVILFRFFRKYHGLPPTYRFTLKDEEPLLTLLEANVLFAIFTWSSSPTLLLSLVYPSLLIVVRCCQVTLCCRYKKIFSNE